MTLELVRAYYRIGDTDVRKRIFDMDILNRAKARDYQFLRRYLALPRSLQKAARKLVRALGDCRNLGD